MLEDAEFHKNHHLKKRFEKGFSITWEPDKEIISKHPICSLYKDTPLLSGTKISTSH